MSSWLRRSSEPVRISSDHMVPYEFHEDFDDTHSNYSDESGLDSVSSTGALRPLTCEIAAPRIDSYRFSMANLEDSQDVDLDAILGELCALESQCEREIGRAQQHKRTSQSVDPLRQPHQSRTHSRSSSEGNRLKLESNEGEQKTDGTTRTDSPDNDSAFSDTVSMLSSESSASSGTSGTKAQGLTLSLGSQTAQDSASRAKAEKIRMALEKMKEASVKKLFIKAFTVDGSTKSLLVDEKMVCGYVTQLLADKNHVQMDPKWAIVEHLPDLYMERVYEDHELLVENLMHWTRDSKNKILFVERPEKIQLFIQPENFLISQTDKQSANTDYDEHTRSLLLEEFFSSNSNTIPEVEGPLYLKSESKKGWKKYNFVLRASGLYYWPKEKAKTSRDLVCLATFDVNQVYYGVGWKKKYKAPTDYCFAIKHPRLQQPKSTKYIKFLCAEDSSTLERWMIGIRIAKHGRQLMDNYRSLIDDLAQDDLDQLAHARSCSVSSIAIQSNQSTVITPTGINTIYAAPSEASSGRHSRASSSSSSGCMSDGAPSSCENAFDSEFPMGTIKRKPSMKPSLPLTSITRQLKEVGETRDTENDSSQANCQSPSTVNGGSYTSTGTLTRRHSRRKSSSTDDSSNSSTLKRQHLKSRGSIESMGGRSGSSTPVGTPVRERSSPFSPDHSSNSTNSPVTSPVVSSPVNVGSLPKSMTDSVTSLPPPPEPSNYDPENDDSESYPPPPPEMFRSTLSLDSLPPPPAPGELPSLPPGSENLTGSQLSLMSLPPAPVIGDTNTMKKRTKTSTTNILSPDNSSLSSLPLSPDATPTHSRLNTPCFSPPPLSIGSNCSTPTHINPPTCFSPTPVPLHSNQVGYPHSNGENDIDENGSPIFAVKPPAYVAPPAYSRPSSTLPIERSNAQSTTAVLRSSLRQQSLPRQISVNSTVSSGSNSSANTVYSIPPYLAELQARNSPQTQRKVNFQEPPMSPKKTKKISFNLTPQEAPALPKKPPPPKRSEKTKLSSPKKLADSNSAPPTDFLRDLQRVMKKKWQVAQKCKLEPSTTPHEVLGFRDPPPPIADYRETNVSNWVQEHYGANNVYENVISSNPETVVVYATSPINFGKSELNSSVRWKRPPPPPPKRSETTQLTTQKLH